MTQNIIFKKTVLKRDNYTCQDCGEKDRRCLTVHHKDKENHPFNPEYGVCLCRNCQAKIHIKPKREKNENR